MDALVGRRPHCPHVPSGRCPLDDATGGCGLALCHEAQRVHALRRGSYLFSQGDDCRAVHCVLRGLIALEQIDPSGGVMIVRLVRPGELLGCADLFHGREHCTSARVVDDAVVRPLSEVHLIEAIEENAAFAVRLLNHAAAEAHAFALFAQRMASLPVDARILALLHEFSGGRQSFPLPVAKKDLAYLAGTRPEVLSRTLVKLQAAGVIRMDGTMVFLSPDDVAVSPHLCPAGGPAQGRATVQAA